MPPLGRLPSARLGPSLAMGGILVLALVLRLHDLGDKPLWIDEAATYRFASAPLHLLWGETAARETNPPLYATLIRWVVLPWSSSPGALRLPSALLGVASVALVYAIGRVAGGIGLGLVAALLLATNANHVGIGQEARSYSLLVCTCLLATLGLMLLLNRPRDAARSLWSSLAHPAAHAASLSAWLMYFVGTALALWSHNTAVLLPAIASLLMIVAAVRAPEARRGLLYNWTLVNLLVLLSWAWWAPRMLEQSLYILENQWSMPFTTWGSMVHTVRAGIGQRHLGRLRDAGDLAMLAAFAAGLWVACRQPKLRVPAAFAVGVLGGVFLIGFWKAIVVFRTAFWPGALVMVVMAAGLLAAPRRWVRVAAVLVLVALNLRTTYSYFSYVEKSDWPTVAAAVQPEPGDAIVILHDLEAFAMHYYADAVLHSAPTYVYMPGDDHRLAPWIEDTLLSTTHLKSGLGGYRRLWVVAGIHPQIDPLFQRVLGEMDFVECGSFGRHKAFGYLFMREPQPLQDAPGVGVLTPPDPSEATRVANGASGRG